MEQIIYKIEKFEGPLDLLLSLLAKNKMSIEEIQISIICDQYMEYIRTMQTLNIELSAEFLVYASQLMLIKSRALLPKMDDEPEEDLLRLQAEIAEYKRAKEASTKLGDLYSVYFGRMQKDTDEISPDRSYVADHDVELLSTALMRIINTIEISEEEASEKIKPLISTRTISVGEKVFSILRVLVENGGRTNVLNCFAYVSSKHESVATFMALLEMLKAGRIILEENTEETEDSDGVIDLCRNVYINLYTGKIRIKEDGYGQ